MNTRFSKKEIFLNISYSQKRVDKFFLIMKILHVIQNLEKEKGGGVTERNLKLIDYLEKKNNINYILSLKSNIVNNSREAFVNKNRNIIKYINILFLLVLTNFLKI